jgi:hypothetical protein
MTGRDAIVYCYNTNTLLLSSFHQREEGECVDARNESGSPESPRPIVQADAQLADLGRRGDVKHLLNELLAVDVARVSGSEQEIIVIKELDHRLGRPTTRQPTAKT